MFRRDKDTSPVAQDVIARTRCSTVSELLVPGNDLLSCDKYLVFLTLYDFPMPLHYDRSHFPYELLGRVAYM